MSYKTIQRDDVKVMQTFIDTMVGIPKFSYPARQGDAPKPAGDFAHIRLIEEYQIGIPNNRIISQDENTTEFQVVSPVKLRFRVGVVDTDGVASSMIMHGWPQESIKQAMIKSGYGFVRCTPLSDETASLEREWETRQGFSIELYTTRIFNYTTDNITSVRGTGKFYKGDYLREIEFEINE
jgi:hypothetical protein